MIEIINNSTNNPSININPTNKVENVNVPVITNQVENIKINDDWWYPSKNGKKRILWAGTHIHQSNGYSRVMYYITKYLGNYDDIELTVYGFQNFNQNQNQTFLRSDVNPSVITVSYTHLTLPTIYSV